VRSANFSCDIAPERSSQLTITPRSELVKRGSIVPGPVGAATDSTRTVHAGVLTAVVAPSPAARGSREHETAAIDTRVTKSTDNLNCMSILRYGYALPAGG
jgi:hypothetical protein